MNEIKINETKMSEIIVCNKETVKRRLQRFGITALLVGGLYFAQPHVSAVSRYFEKRAACASIEQAITESNYVTASNLLKEHKDKMTQDQIDNFAESSNAQAVSWVVSKKIQDLLSKDKLFDTTSKIQASKVFFNDVETFERLMESVVRYIQNLYFSRLSQIDDFEHQVFDGSVNLVSRLWPDEKQKFTDALLKAYSNKVDDLVESKGWTDSGKLKLYRSLKNLETKHMDLRHFLNAGGGGAYSE